MADTGCAALPALGAALALLLLFAMAEPVSGTELRRRRRKQQQQQQPSELEGAEEGRALLPGEAPAEEAAGEDEGGAMGAAASAQMSMV